MLEEEAIEHLKIEAESKMIMPLDDEIEIALNLIEKQNRIIDMMAEDYSEYQINKSKIGEITETKYGILDRICSFLK